MNKTNYSAMCEIEKVEAAIAYAKLPAPKSWKDYLSRLSGALDFKFDGVKS